MLNVLIILLLGFFIGSLINILFNKIQKPYVKSYFNHFKNLKSILVFVLVEVVLVIIYKKYGINLKFFNYVALFSVLIFASLTDLRDRSIPNRLIIIGFSLGIIFSAVTISFDVIFNSFLGAIVSGGMLLILSLLSKGGIGMGDVKLLACTGLYFGFYNAMAVVIVATILSGLFAIALLITKKYKQESSIPFAPFIFLGSFITLLNI